jgi:hypothetical protein
MNPALKKFNLTIGALPFIPEPISTAMTPKGNQENTIKQASVQHLNALWRLGGSILPQSCSITSRLAR